MERGICPALIQAAILPTMWRHLLRNKRWVAMPLLAALVVPWLPGMVASCVLYVASETSHCQQQPLKKQGAPTSKPACHEVTAKICIHCADILPAVVQVTPTPSANAIMDTGVLWHSSATHLLPPVVYTASPLTPLESTLANRVLLI